MIEQVINHTHSSRAVAVDGYCWDDIEYKVGDIIAFDVHVRYEGDRESQYDRLEGMIVELWREWWANGKEELLYAEVREGSHNQRWSRVWFHRDNVGQPTGFTGPITKDGLF